MSNLFTQAAVQALAKEVGWDVEAAKTIAAIAMVESATSVGGKSYADADKEGDQNLVNATYGYSYGLCQVRSIKAQLNTGGLRDGSRLKDPKFNLHSALAIWRDAGFRAWSTYNSGQYQAYLQDQFPPPADMYVVVGGDSLSTIASRFLGFSWQQLATVNGIIAPYVIAIGQRLKLPVWTYTVKSGDTLTSIAANYSKVTANDLASYNRIANPDMISVGQPIRIPDPILLHK